MQRILVQKSQRKIVIRVTVLFSLFLLLFGMISLVALQQVIIRQDEQNILNVLQNEVQIQEQLLANSEDEDWEEREWNHSFEESIHEDQEHRNLPRLSRTERTRGNLFFRYERARNGQWGAGIERISNLHRTMQQELKDWMPDSGQVRTVVVPLQSDQETEMMELLVAAAPFSRGWIYIGTDAGIATTLWQSAMRWLMVVVVSFTMIGSLLAWWLTKRSLQPVKEAMIRQAQFVTNASHEFRTPLSVMQTSLDCLTVDSAIQSSENARKWLTNLQEEVERMTGMIDRLLAMARMEQKDALVLERFDFTQSVEKIVERMSLQAREREVTIRASVGPSIEWDGDRVLVEELMTILIDNAIQHSPRGGEVVCRLDVTKESKSSTVLRMEVEDKGNGIAPEQLAYVFDRFYRGDVARTSRNGLGVGLSIAKTIVEAHRGTIGVQSEVGKGTIFRVTFPRYK